MSKKDNTLKIAKHNIARIGTMLMGMVAAPGVKKEKGVSRAESAALSYGLSMGIGIGFLLAVDSDYRKKLFGSDKKLITKREGYCIACEILSDYINDLPEHRAKMLAVKEDGPGVVKVTIEQQEVR